VGLTLGLPWPVGLAGAVIASGLLGGVLSLATLRLRADFLALATLIAAESLHSVANELRGVTGADVGLVGVPEPVADLTVTRSEATIVTLLIYASILIGTYILFRRLTDSPYGRVLSAIKDDETAASAVGKGTFRYKSQVFIYGSIAAGIAGSLLSFYYGAVAPGQFTLSITILVWAGMLIGGAGTLGGALGGLFILLTFQLATRFIGQTELISAAQVAPIRQIIVGLLLVLIIRFKSEGIWGDSEKQRFQ
jgi:branched-chain amino acid transport system permease protein